MRLGKNAAGRNASPDGAKRDLISKLELTIAAAVDAIENLLRTQFVLSRGGSGEFARHVGRSGRNFAGPYSSLLFSIILYAAMSMWLYAWLDQIQHVEYDQLRSSIWSLPMRGKSRSPSNRATSIFSCGIGQANAGLSIGSISSARTIRNSPTSFLSRAAPSWLR